MLKHSFCLYELICGRAEPFLMELLLKDKENCGETYSYNINESTIKIDSAVLENCPDKQKDLQVGKIYIHLLMF